ncbi:hypothetical protein Nepgr_021225 [Nepenthes gracilis]|uniref:DUF569 domain-containing protein n=1 Tax=Nepenthes gracilis TaxID=150966 RepID=A0AAD3SZ64_NEPGR|nr:hypothetical protein Nepgr_021225 [Nepenthes gracilis]
MEFFHGAKAVRLRSQHNKYLVAEDNEEIVWQSGDGASRSARWEVELVEGKSNAIRLKNCKTWKYLSASDEAFLLGWTGKRVVQASPRMKLDASVEWEPVKEGSHLKLKSLKGKGMFLRANGFTPPWKNSVTHDLPGRTATQDWILWRVDILENDHQNDKSIGKNSPDPGATKAIFTSADEKEKEEAETLSSASSSSSVNSAAYYGSGSPVSVRSVHSSSQITEPVIITRRSTSVDSETAASHWKPKVSSFGRRATSNVSQESSPHSNSFSKLKSVLDDVEKLLDGEAAEVVETNTTAKPPATTNTLEVRMAKETLKEVEDLDFNSVSSSGRLKRLEKAIDVLLHSANDHDDQSYSKFIGLQRQIRALKDDHDAASDDLRRYSIFSAERSAVKMELKADTTKARELEIAESECNRVLITAYEKKEELLKQLEEVEKSIEDAEREQAQNTAEIERVISVIAQKSESLREMERRERSWQVSKSLAEKKLLQVEDDWARLKCSFSA